MFFLRGDTIIQWLITTERQKMSKDILFDLAWFRPDSTNQALELLFKARQEGDEDFIWSPHDSVLIRKLIELFTQRGLMRLDSVKKSLLRWQSKSQKNQYGGSIPAKPETPLMPRWDSEEKELVEIYLNNLPSFSWGLDDHMLALELTIQTYLPEDELIEEAQWLATKANMMGKVQQNWLKEKEPSNQQAEKILAGMPGSPEEAAHFPMSDREQKALEYANFRAVENVVSLADNVRKKMRYVVAEDVMKREVGDVSGPSLESKLFDEFADLNRDWRRIAVTEAGECQLQGFIAGAKEGSKVKRVEQYPSACPFCKSIHGKIATVVSPMKKNKDPDNEIWPGKNNVGRAAAPRKRVGGALVPRPKEEQYWLPAGLAHPHCRGRWVNVEVPDEAADPEFAKILAVLTS